MNSPGPVCSELSDVESAAHWGGWAGSFMLLQVTASPFSLPLCFLVVHREMP